MICEDLWFTLREKYIKNYCYRKSYYNCFADKHMYMYR